MVLMQQSALASDEYVLDVKKWQPLFNIYFLLNRVGRLNIIDLSSNTSLYILHSELQTQNMSEITAATAIKPVQLSDYAREIFEVLEACPLSVRVLTDTLYENEFRKEFYSLKIYI
jgi:hypothetical protein